MMFLWFPAALICYHIAFPCFPIDFLCFPMGPSFNRRERGEESSPKIFEQLSQKSILHRWYTQIPISHPHGTIKTSEISCGDVHTAEFKKFNQWGITLSLTWAPTWDPKIVLSRAAGRFPQSEFDTMIPSMFPSASYTQRGSKIIQIISFKRSRGGSPKETFY